MSDQTWGCSSNSTLSLELESAVRLGETQNYPPGVELFSQGGAATYTYLVDNGLIKLIRSEGNGREIVIDLKFPGSLVGSAAAIAAKPHAFSAITVTRSTLTRWSSSQFLLLMAADASTSRQLNEILSMEVLDHAARLSQLASLPARQRLEQFLWDLCERLKPGDLIIQSSGESKLQLPLKHSDVANLISVTPTYLCRLLNGLESDRIITRRKGWIRVKSSALWHAPID